MSVPRSAADLEAIAERVQHAPQRDGDQLMAAIPAGPNIELRVFVRADIRGRPIVDLRAWRRYGGAFFPTKHGLSILQRQVIDVIAALQLAEEQITATKRKERNP